MAIPFTTEARIKAKMGAQKWLQYFDDDNDGVVTGSDQNGVLEVIADACADVESVLVGKGYSHDQLVEMAGDGDTGDEVLSRCATSIAMGYAGERRVEFVEPSSGKGPWDGMRERAMARLKLLAKAQERLPSEQQSGRNKQIGGRLSKLNRPDERHFQFASNAVDRANGSRGPGGF